jgi:threonine/homoserine/homoserine lactone efflux protein
MTLTIFLALCVFSLVSSVTPGPNNVMLFASGVNFGFTRTIPHMLGISIGFGVMLAAVGAGIGALVTQVPSMLLAIKVIGGIYMLWLAWKIANSGPVEQADGTAKPMTFMQAALFQWVNPKAWMMGTFAMATYTTIGNYWVNVALICLAFTIINLPCVAVWAGFGQALREILKDPLWLRIFNITMALALVVSLWPMLAV